MPLRDDADTEQDEDEKHDSDNHGEKYPNEHDDDGGDQQDC